MSEDEELVERITDGRDKRPYDARAARDTRERRRRQRIKRERERGAARRAK